MSTQTEGNLPATIDPIPLPVPRRPGILPSLPEWAERCSVAVRPELQMTADQRAFAEVLVIPEELMPTPAQRAAMTNHVDSLRSYLQQTAERSVEFEARIATAVSKLLMVLAGEKKSELAEEARSDVYLDVLDDLPCWAVEEAVRKWFRHDCGADEKGNPYDYKWSPDPGALRRIAFIVSFEMKQRIQKMENVLNAQRYIDFSDHFEKGRAALKGLNKAKEEGDASSLTFDEAVKLGSVAWLAATVEEQG
jgi:hypothetical protein